MRICRVKSTKRIIGMQSDATPGTLVKNALSEFGLTSEQVEEIEVDHVGYEAAKAEDPVEILVCISAKSAEVKAVRDAKIAAGIPFMFPDGLGTIQTRDLVDSRNIQTNVTMALILTMSGETDPVLTFRDMENVEHTMTPAQMLQMGAYAAQQGQVVYSQSWTLESQMATMSPAELLAFDVAANWPN